MDFQDQDIQISRSGYYTVTFENTSCLSEEEVRRELGTVGEIRAAIWKKNRVFIRYKYKDEAQRALTKYGKLLNVQPAFNSKRSAKPQYSMGAEEDYDYYYDNENENENEEEEEEVEAQEAQKAQEEQGEQREQGEQEEQEQEQEEVEEEEEKEEEEEEEEEEDDDDLKSLKKQISPMPKSVMSETNITSINFNNSHSAERFFCLILSNLPQKYTFKDVRALIEEAKPVWVELDETKVFNIRFAYVILDSLPKMSYLIEKLNGFVICGEKLVAVEASRLLKWRNKKDKNNA